MWYATRVKRGPPPARPQASRAVFRRAIEGRAFIPLEPERGETRARRRGRALGEVGERRASENLAYHLGTMGARRETGGGIKTKSFKPDVSRAR